MLKDAIRYENDFVNRAMDDRTAACRLEDPLDRWLRTELDTLYRDVLDEPLPADLEDLARRLQAKLDEKEPNNGSGTS